MRCSSQEGERLTRTDCVSALYMGPDPNPTWTHVARFFGNFLVCLGVCSISLVVSCVPTLCLNKLLGINTMWIVPPAQTMLLLGAALSELTVSMPRRSRNEAQPNVSWVLP